ncbi:MAG TPA: tyrosine--tRNA ligase [Myxococcota bacterium]|nr:tyrosine--tRNA ligase [Myxococcota bacterium]
MQFLDTLRERGFVHQITDEVALHKALYGGPMVFYCGFDPTASSLHIGSLLQLMLMGHLVRAGHSAIGVVGGGTGMVGDPSGRDSTRDILTPERIQENLVGISAQIRRFCPDAEVIDNGDWLLSLKYVEFLRDIGKHFSVNRMLTADSVRNRLERDQGLSFIEFNYVLLQSYDFLELYRRYGCRLQIGGQDQWFNILMGTELIRRMEGVDSWGITTPLLATASGAKMGKTASGAVWLDASRTSAYDYYQYWYNVDDRDVGRFLKLYTWLPIPEIKELEAGDFRVAKHRLAYEATLIAHGESHATDVQQAIYATFGKPGEKKVFSVAEETPTWATMFPVPVLDALVGSGLCKSKSEARQKIKEAAVKIGADRADFSDEKAMLEEPTILWVGKKNVRNIISLEGVAA